MTKVIVVYWNITPYDLV